MLAKLLPKIMSAVQPKIVVVGAGAAGIAAATKLFENGFRDVTVLEAENRIGGRIHSVGFEGTVVDLGAQWVHGEECNVIYQIVKELDLISPTKTANYENLTFFTSDNSKISTNLTERFHQIASEVLEDQRASLEHDGSLGDYFRDSYYNRISREFGNNNEGILKTAKMVEEWIGKLALCYDPAESWDQISVHSLATYQKCPGNQLFNWRNKGFATMFDVLMTDNLNKSEQLQLKNNILVNKEVDSIVWEQDSETKKVKIECTDGSVYLADHVIITLSVGVLKHTHETLFQPRLPEYKINCVENISLGNVHKILLKFPTKWWPDDVHDLSFLWAEEDKRKLLEEFPDGPIQNNRSWLEDVFGFYTVDSHPEILLGWVVGPMTQEVELLPDEVVQNASMFLLKKFVGQKYDVPEPEHILRSQWGTNPHFRGTYSYVSTKMENHEATHEDLAKPLTVDGTEVVLFAGEATHSKYFSTVHGAVESGYREADRLIKRYENSKYYKTAIVGAGLAGLGAATKLVENEINDFLILEAQNQPGGRIRTIYVDNKPIDLGAQWLHGMDNELYKLAIKYDLLSDDTTEEGLGSYVKSNGEVVDPYTVKLLDFKIGQILEECAKFVNSEDYPPSLAQYLDHRFDEYLKDQDLDNNRLEDLRELYDWHVRFQVIDNSCKNLSRLSAKSWGEYICRDDFAHYNLKYGYESLIQVILDSLPNDCISYDSEVTEISFLKDKRIKLYLKDGRIIICDHLILTTSLGILKEFSGLSTMVPDNLMKSIQNMGFAGISKIYLFYDEKWWEDSHGFQLLWTEDCNFSEKHSWLRQVTGFDEILNHPNALMAWVGGDAVQEVETLHTDDIGKQCTNLLRKFLPNYSVPVPNKVIRTKWLSHPFVKGSYCHITPECDDANLGIRTLGQPVIVDGVPRIVLAGEAIHPSHYSTTHGAYESGKEQAQIITEYISAL